MRNIRSEHPLKIEFYRDKVPMFERFNVEREIERALRRKIWLPSGGYLFFDRTEAMYTIDVNSGRSSVANNLNDRRRRDARPDQHGSGRRDRTPAAHPQYRRPCHLRLHRHALAQKSAARPRPLKRCDERRFRQMHHFGHERIWPRRNDTPAQPRIADADDLHPLPLLHWQRHGQDPREHRRSKSNAR